LIRIATISIDQIAKYWHKYKSCNATNDWNNIICAD
jgi:hypothetical protein